ncbi:hypothetical protein CAPN001_11750 [Capnocytophaga stomatis]|uniref:hypothetical protein n=1 Tax=Capnocytophaga stomatis TaxID=1848904 RepID=UPI001950F31B|nr:hypothetical protein [Capnocytophaga stomatis]GIJ96606.1 hypothetical protein CAPN001_11750 [Capnocytophaga stomatis]
MTAKVQQKSETAKFSVEKGKLCCNGKTYIECDFDEKQDFNERLSQDDDKLLAMLQRTTKPLISQFVPSITSTKLYKTKPHFV